jgi:hypothetical protein
VLPDLPGVVAVVVPSARLVIEVKCLEQTADVIGQLPLDRNCSQENIGNVALYCDELNHLARMGFWFLRFCDGYTAFRHSFSAIGIQMTTKFIHNFVNCLAQRVIAFRRRMNLAMDGVPYTQLLAMDD